LKKKYYLYLFASIIIAGIGFGIYKWNEYHNISPVWRNIPADALMVIEIKKPIDVLNWKSAPWLDFIEAIDLNILFNRIAELEKINKNFTDYLLKNRIVASLHTVNNHNLDYIYYLPLSAKDKKILDSIKNKFINDPLYKFESRNFQDKRISEIIFRQNPKLIFSFIIQDDVLIASYTSLLIEDVIRNTKQNFLSENQLIKNVNFVENNDVLNIYINSSGLSGFIKTISKDFLNDDFSSIASSFDKTKLQIEPLENQLAAFGKTSVTKDEKTLDYLKIFQNQKPQPISCLKILPENTALLYHWGISDPKIYIQKLNDYWLSFQPTYISNKVSTQKKYNLNINSFNEWLGNEIASCRLENSEEDSRLLFIQTSNADKAIDFLNKSAKSIDLQSNTNPYLENYNGINIRQIHLEQFPSLLLGTMANGFSQCFYTQYENYIVFGSGLETIKRWIDDVNNQRTWAYSNQKKDIISKLQEKSNFTFLADVSRSWPIISVEADKNIFSKMSNKEGLWKNFSHVALQLESAGTEFQTNLLATYNKSTTAENVLGKAFINQKIKLDTTSQLRPFVFTKENGRSILIQNSKNKLFNINQTGKINWVINVSSAIQNNIFSIKNLKNENQSYAFITASEFDLINGKGDMVENFPIHTSSATELHSLSVIDYDRKKDYRFLVSDKAGDVFMYNKEGKVLPGWNPKKSGYRFNSSLKHIKVAGKDYIFGIQINGAIQVWNRKGQNISGFPLIINEHIISEIFIKNGATQQETILITITEKGEIIEFNLEGKIINRIQLFRPSAESSFQLCMDTDEKDWFVIRQENQKINILNKKGDAIINKEVDNFNKNSIVQYYDFGADVKLFFITQPDLKKTFVFDRNGKEISNEIENNKAVSLLYQSSLNKVLIYCTHDKYLNLVSVKVK